MRLPHPTPAELLGTRPCWMLDLTWGGAVWRVASEPCAVSTVDGRTLSYSGGLDVPELTEELDVLGLGVDAARATVEFVLQGLDVPLRHRSHHLLRAEATLWLGALRAPASMGVPTLEQRADRRWHQLTGYLRSPEFADPSRPAGWVRATVREAPWDSKRRLVSRAALLSLHTWPLLDDEAVGKILPIVIGAPGADGSAGSPAYCSERTGAGDATYLLIAAHQVAATQVTIIDEAGAAEVFAVAHEPDAFGAIRARVDVSGATVIDQQDVEFWASWTAGGGMFSVVGAGAMTSAVDVLVWAITSSGLPADVGRWRAASDRLPDIAVAAYLTEFTPAWEWIQKHVLPLLPLSIRRGPEGMYPVLLDPRPQRSQRVPVVISTGAAGGGPWVQQGGVRVESDPGDLVRDQVVQYSHDGRLGAFQGSLTWTARPNPALAETGGSLYTDHAAAAFGAVGTDEAEPLALRSVSDAASAGAVASWRARLLGAPVETIEARAGWGEGWIGLGRPCSLTATLPHYADQAALVTRRRWARGEWVLEWSAWPDVVRDARPA